MNIFGQKPRVMSLPYGANPSAWRRTMPTSAPTARPLTRSLTGYARRCTHIYREEVTGARRNRRELLKLLRVIGSGDVVTVTHIDRLARSTFNLFAIVKQIVDGGGQFRSLAEPWADASTSTRRLLIAVLGGLADVERDPIRTRTAEGRSRAKAAGSTWAVARSSRRSSRTRYDGDGRELLRSLPRITMSGRATISRLALSCLTSSPAW